MTNEEMNKIHASYNKEWWTSALIISGLVVVALCVVYLYVCAFYYQSVTIGMTAFILTILLNLAIFGFVRFRDDDVKPYER